MKRSLIAISCGALFAACFFPVASPCEEATAWVAGPEEGAFVVYSISSEGLGEPVAVAESGASSLPGSLALNCIGLPAVAWLNNEGDILYSAFDGINWSAPETVCFSEERHRGVPSLAVWGEGEAAVAWAEAETGAFEDIFYTVRRQGRWGETCRAHERNDVPDIIPRARASADGRFSFSWRRLEGDHYVERHMGDGIAAPGQGEAPEGIIEALMKVGLPARAAVAWRDGDGSTHSVYFKEFLGEQAESTGLEREKSGIREADRSGITTKIVAFGDSITYGVGSSSNEPKTGYPVYLQAILEYDYPGHSFEVINKGNPGERTDSGLDRIDDVLDRYRPQYILIMEGTNDIYLGISFETIQENLKQMALRARKKGVVPVLATIIPTHPNVRYEQYVMTKSFYLGRYVQELWDRNKIPYSDQWNAFVSVPDFGSLINPNPGNHPNDDGYLFVMSPQWYATLAPLLINLPFEPTAVMIGVDANAPSVVRGAVETFTYSLTPSNDIVRNAVDCYVAMRMPDGRFYFFDSGWNLTSRTTPVARKVLLQNFPSSGLLLNFSVSGSAPPGSYTLFIVTVRALRDVWNSEYWTSNLASVSFEVTE